MAELGRPSEYTQEAADAICELLTLGWSLKRVIEKGKDEPGYENIGFPSIATVYKWMRENEDFLKNYARAKQEAADAMAEELLDISDDGKNDWMEIWDKEGQNIVGWKVNGEAVMRSKLRVDTRKWIMAKMKPKRYGEKLDLTSGGDKIKQQPLIISDIASRKQDEDAAAQTETS